MIHLLIYSLVAGIVAALLVVPLHRPVLAKEKESHSSSIRIISLISATVLITLAISLCYYMTNLDQHWSSLWVLLLVAAILGAVLDGGMYRKAKGIVALLSIFAGIYILSAPLWNADTKYKVVEMDQQVEIEAFDETKTPASVPPKFARNKMKKAFGQVPNTSYYDLGHLQIQK